MAKLSLQDRANSFEVTVLESTQPSRVVLFAVGGGGNPERHLPLLTHLAEHGCKVVAPHFERLPSPRVTEQDLRLRGRRLNLALDAFAPKEMELVALGHSIGATMLLALAGGQVWLRMGEQLSLDCVRRLAKLALLTPATGFFQAPQALDAVTTAILAWAGSNDTLTPPEQAQFLKQALGDRAVVEVRVVQGAGHFSFMNAPPPGTLETLTNRDAFLAELAEAIHAFFLS